MKKGLRRGLWSPEEDEKLRAYIKRYGIWNWTKMPEPAGLSRTGKSCRLRWLNYLRPGIKLGNYTIEEEETIIRMHRMVGNRWCKIAAALPGRTDNEIKNHWHTNLKNSQSRRSINISMNHIPPPPTVLESAVPETSNSINSAVTKETFCKNGQTSTEGSFHNLPSCWMSFYLKCLEEDTPAHKSELNSDVTAGTLSNESINKYLMVDDSVPYETDELDIESFFRF